MTAGKKPDKIGLSGFPAPCKSNASPGSCGYVHSADTGLYYLQSRYYNPKSGRFLNADALVSTGQGLLGNNMFAYCRNNPVSRIDISGREDLEIYLDDGSDGDVHFEPIDPKDAAPSAQSTPPVGQSYGSTGGGVNSSTSGVAQSNSNSQNGSSNLGQGKSASSSNLDRPVSPRQVSKGALKNVDVHAFKQEFVNNDGSSWDLYKDTAHNAAIWLGNKSQTVWIPTGYVLEQLIEFFSEGWK